MNKFWEEVIFVLTIIVGIVITGVHLFQGPVLLAPVELPEGEFVNTYFDGSKIKLLEGEIEGTYETNVLDTKMLANWTNFSWGEPFEYKVSLDKEEGMLLLCHFDNSLICEDGEEGVGDLAFEEGIFNEAPYFNKKVKYDNLNEENFKKDSGSIEFWVKPNWGVDDDEERVFFATMPVDVNLMNNFFVLSKVFKDSKTKIRLKIYEKHPDLSWTIEKSVHWDNDEWHHVVAVWDLRDGTEMVGIYVDGLLVVEDIGNPPGISLDSISDQIFVGSPGPDKNAASANIDEFVIYNYPLFPEIIIDHHKKGAANLNFQVRSCDDENCFGEEYNGVYFENASFGNLSSLEDNRYVQFKAYLSAEHLGATSELLALDYNFEKINYVFVNLTNPENGSSLTNTNVLINWNINATSLDSCGYILNEEVYLIEDCLANSTNVILINNVWNNLSFFANDSYTEITWDNITLFVNEAEESDESSGGGDSGGSSRDCYNDGDCSAGEICEDDDCVSGCRDDSGCDDLEVCEEEICVEVGCVSDNDCSSGEECLDNECLIVEVIEVETAECYLDEECGEGYICENNVCFESCEEEVCVEVECVSDDDCSSGEECVDNTCTVIFGQIIESQNTLIIVIISVTVVLLGVAIYLIVPYKLKRMKYGKKK